MAAAAAAAMTTTRGGGGGGVGVALRDGSVIVFGGSTRKYRMIMGRGQGRLKFAPKLSASTLVYFVSHHQ